MSPSGAESDLELGELNTLTEAPDCSELGEGRPNENTTEGPGTGEYSKSPYWFMHICPCPEYI